MPIPQKHQVWITVKQAASILGISESALAARMRKQNITLQQAIDVGPSMRKRIEVGDKYGYLVVVEVLPALRGGNARVIAKCSCGRLKETLALALKNGHVCSCGECEISREWHGLSKTKTYESWRGMIARCNNASRPDFHHYGGRGIRVCDAWKKSFTAFLRDMGERPTGMTLDRINPDGNYAPDNCRWADKLTQSQNRRTAGRGRN